MQPYSSSIDTTHGTALRGASVAVKLNGALATIYALDGSPQANPMTTDSTGSYAFRAANGEYTLEISRVGIVPKTETVMLYDPADDVSSTGNLASTADSKGAGLVGFSAVASYAAGTVGAWLKSLVSSAGSSLIGFIQSGAGAVERTVQDKLRETVSDKDHGAVADGSTNDGPALQAALTSNQGFIHLSDGLRVLNGVTLGAFDGFGGEKLMESRVLTDGVTVDGAFTEIKNVRFDTQASPNYAITYATVPGNIFANFASHLNNVRVYGLNGISNGGAETKIQNTYGYGTGYLGGGTFINITNWDTSLHTVECEEYGTGIRTAGRGVQALDAHLVRCGTGAAVQAQGHPTQFVNTYLDSSKKYGMQFNDMSNVAIVNAYVLNTGVAETASEATGFLLDATSTDNNFFNVYFKQADAALWTGGFGFQAGSINNLIVGAGGDYKLSTNSRDRIRNQTVVGAHGGWARHNNVPRQNRAYAPAVAVAAQATLTFQLDWEYPALTFNTVLFVGNYVSRTTTSKASVGRVLIPIQYTDIGCAPVLEKLTGSVNNNWAIISASLSGSVLSVVVQNNSEATAGISVEIARSLDAIGSTY